MILKIRDLRLGDVIKTSSPFEREYCCATVVQETATTLHLRRPFTHIMDDSSYEAFKYQDRWELFELPKDSDILVTVYSRFTFDRVKL